MGSKETISEVASACIQRPGEVRQDLQGSRRALPVGIRLENLSSVLQGPAATHTNGAREARRAQQY